MTLLAWAGLAFVILIIAGLTVRQLQSKESDQARSPLAAATQLFAPAEPLRMRSQFDVETDEDLAVICDVYRDQRKAERARQALERLAPLVPTSSKK